MLRLWRDRVAPEAAGIARGSRRRAAGLRREELAGLAGISADYLTRLEQGRATSPSNQVIESLARALRLADDDRALLFRLAGRVAPGPGLVPRRIPPSVSRILDRLAHTPVAVYDAAGDLVVANAPYEALMGASADLRGRERNSVWRNFVGSGSRAVLSPEEREDLRARMVVDLRRASARYPADAGLRQLIADLGAHSPRFAELWAGGDGGDPSAPSRRKTIAHPAVGPITLDCDTLIVADDDLHVLIYTAEPGTADAERLALAIVVGTQELVE
jgi:transcriptional regulator with XRE-family HTH domain